MNGAYPNIIVIPPVVFLTFVLLNQSVKYENIISESLVSKMFLKKDRKTYTVSRRIQVFNERFTF